MARKFLILGGVAVALALLDAHAHRKGLGLHGNAPAAEHLKGVPGRVSGAKEQGAAGQTVRPLRAFHSDGGKGPIFHFDIRKFTLKADIRPQREELRAKVFQHNVEIIRAHMGLGVDQNVLRCAVLYQLFQNKAVADIFCAGIQLTVGKGARAALTELDVAGQVQLTGGPKALYILGAPLHAASPLQQNGLEPRFGQNQCGKKPRRPRAHHNGRNLGCRLGQGQQVAHLVVGLADPLVAAALDDLFLLFHLHFYGVHHPHALPGVDAAAKYMEGGDVLFLHVQLPGGFGGKVRRGGTGKQLHIFDPKQWDPPFQRFYFYRSIIPQN